MKIPPAILTLRQASDLKKPAPYSYVLESGAQKLFMFGAAHFRPSTDPQFDTMRTMWEEFKTSESPKIVIVESGVGPVAPLFEDSVATGREAGATVWFGLRDSIGILCADLDFRQRLLSLAKEFDASSVAYWVLAREMDIYFRKPGARTAEEVLESHLTKYRKLFNEIGVSGDRAWFDGKHAEFSNGKPINDEEYWDFVNSWRGPQVFMDIIESESRMRNERVYGVLKHLWELGYSVFVTYGATHAVQLEPVLRKLTE